MATMEDIRMALENDAKVVAEAQARLAATRELLRAEVTARTNAVKSAQDIVEGAVNATLSSGKVAAANKTVYDTYGKGAYLNVRVNLDDNTVEYKWPSLTLLVPGAGIPKTPRAGGKSTAHVFTALDTSLPKTTKPDGLSYEQWLGIGKTEAFKRSATAEQLVEVDAEQAAMKEAGASQAAIGSMVDKYRNDVIGQAVASGKLTPVR